jgi:hypothetical protein
MNTRCRLGAAKAILDIPTNKKTYIEEAGLETKL